MNDAFPNCPALKCLFDRDRLGKRGGAAVLRFYGGFQLSNINLGHLPQGNRISE